MTGREDSPADKVRAIRDRLPAGPHRELADVVAELAEAVLNGQHKAVPPGPAEPADGPLLPPDPRLKRLMGLLPFTG